MFTILVLMEATPTLMAPLRVVLEWKWTRLLLRLTCLKFTIPLMIVVALLGVFANRIVFVKFPTVRLEGMLPKEHGPPPLLLCLINLRRRLRGLLKLRHALLKWADPLNGTPQLVRCPL